MRPVAASLLRRRRTGPDIGRQFKHHCDGLPDGFVARADPGALKDQAETPPAGPRQRSQGRFKIQPRGGGYTGALRNLINLFRKGAQVLGNMTGRQF
jgi:hypothetical protein